MSTGRRVRDTFQRNMTNLHTRFLRATGWRIGAKMGRAPILVLHTTGRVTGKQRITPLLYLDHGDDLAVVASNGGDSRMPRWYLNLTDHPAVLVEIGGETRPFTARTASPDEKSQLWPLLLEIYGTYEKYQRRTTREIPVVILTPRTP